MKPIVTHASSIASKLEALLTEKVAECAAIKITIAVLTGQARAQAQANGSGLIAKALQIDETRRDAIGGNGHRPPPIRAVKPDGPRAKREKSAAWLAGFDPVTPKPAVGRGVAAFVQAGYLKRKGSGYIRTPKPYSVSQYVPNEQSSAKARRRRGSVEFLKRFSKTTPVKSVPHLERHAGAMLRHGYLKKTANGYLRTDKEFRV